MNFKLRTKIFITFVLVSLVPLALLSLVGIYVVNATQQYNIEQLERQLLSQKEKEIEKFLTDVKTLFHVQVASQVSAISGIPFDQQEFLLEEMIRANKYITEVSFLEYDSSYPEKPGNGMELAMRMTGGATRELEDRRVSPAFKKAIQGEDYFGFILNKDEEYFLPIAAPIKNKDGIIIGVITGTVSLKPVTRLIIDGRLGDSGYLLLADEKGELLVKPPNLSYAHFGSQVFILSVLNGYAGGVQREEEYQSSFGKLVIASGKKLKDVDWALVAEWPKSDAYAAVYSIINQAAWFLLMILAMVAVVSVLFAYRILKPIRILEKGAKIIGEGNLDHRIALETKDELESLANSFNAMAKNLKGIEELREAKARLDGLARSLAKEKELSQIKDHFIATASHQLRTPISVIRWTAEGLATPGDEPIDAAEMKSRIADLYKNAESLSKVVGDLLTISELGIGYKPAVISPFSLREKAKEVMDGFESEAKKKGVTLHLAESASPCMVQGSILNIARAMEHLLDNAVMYTKVGGTIFVEVIEENLGVTFSVKDDGIGVPEKDQKFLFGEFFRATNSIEAKNVGTGLGLFIVKTIVEGHGGKVACESPALWGERDMLKKTGSRFFFTIPTQRTDKML